MKVWIVGISDCESNSIVCLCSTKELAIKKMFAERDRLVAEYQKSYQHWIEKDLTEDNMYKNMIQALSGDDYENWDNYPHDRPYIHEMEVLEVRDSLS